MVLEGRAASPPAAAPPGRGRHHRPGAVRVYPAPAPGAAGPCPRSTRSPQARRY